MEAAVTFRPGSLVEARQREWVVLPETRKDTLRLRPLGGAEEDATVIYLPLEEEQPKPAAFSLPDANKPGSQQAAVLLRDALRLKLRNGAGPFRSFGNINVEPRPYQLVPLMMAMKLDTIRLLIADDVGIGKTIEACLIAREMLDRGEITRFCVICPPHLCEQWQAELDEKFSIKAEIVRTGTAPRLERGLRLDESVFEVYPYTIVSLDYIKSDRRRTDFLRTCPEFVIVDEAHSCVSASGTTKHQRYKLLCGLADSTKERHMLFLTATPHSGDDVAFHNLLGLLDPAFAALAEETDNLERHNLREELSFHFLQRRRGDIDEWKENGGKFPYRQSREATYYLTGEWGQLFDQILTYARSLIARSADGTKQQQRMGWWAALALLRCASSSPAAASMALGTRLQSALEKSEQEQLRQLNDTGAQCVLDTSFAGDNEIVDTVPAANVREDDADALSKMKERAEKLGGPEKDPKIRTLINEIRKLVRNNYRPVVFCRYIATAHYVGTALKKAEIKSIEVAVVTGELTSEQREDMIKDLGDTTGNSIPVLVATDCLSEGVNLQDTFNAVIHYDLTWNPTRHEQREGRVDRYGQPSGVVRALMLYGQNNPVDGAVLRVILEKADKIRKVLGVSVPMPIDDDRAIEAVMKAVLLHPGRQSIAKQMELDFDGFDEEMDAAWQQVADKARRTRFAQRRLKPKDILPEFHKAFSILGGPDDVTRFVSSVTERLGAVLYKKQTYFRMPISYFPKPLQDRLGEIGFKQSTNVAFEHPPPQGADYIHRTHPLVASLADYVVEKTLGANDSEIGARSGAMFTREVNTRTVLYLLRLRYQISIEKRVDNKTVEYLKSLFAEECLGVAVRGGTDPQKVENADALSLLSSVPLRNMADGQKTQLVKQALQALPRLKGMFEKTAKERAKQLLDDHRRIRDASKTKGTLFSVTPSLPVDKIGVYVFLPAVPI